MANCTFSTAHAGPTMLRACQSRRPSRLGAGDACLLVGKGGLERQICIRKANQRHVNSLVTICLKKPPHQSQKPRRLRRIKQNPRENSNVERLKRLNPQYAQQRRAGAAEAEAAAQFPGMAAALAQVGLGQSRIAEVCVERGEGAARRAAQEEQLAEMLKARGLDYDKVLRQAKGSGNQKRIKRGNLKAGKRDKRNRRHKGGAVGSGVHLRKREKSVLLANLRAVHEPRRIPQARLARVKEEVFRDEPPRCLYCASAQDLSVEHLVPLSRGGTFRRANLVLACTTCNARKGSRWPEELINEMMSTWPPPDSVAEEEEEISVGGESRTEAGPQIAAEDDRSSGEEAGD